MWMQSDEIETNQVTMLPNGRLCKEWRDWKDVLRTARFFHGELPQTGAVVDKIYQAFYWRPAPTAIGLRHHGKSGYVPESQRSHQTCCSVHLCHLDVKLGDLWKRKTVLILKLIPKKLGTSNVYPLLGFTIIRYSCIPNRMEMTICHWFSFLIPISRWDK